MFPRCAHFIITHRCNEMGATLSYLCDGLWAGRSRVCVALVGLDNAGKATIFEHLRTADAPSEIPTIGFSFIAFYRSFEIAVFYINNQRLISVLRYYLARCQAIVFVVDSADKARIAEAAESLHSVLESPKPQRDAARAGQQAGPADGHVGV